MLINPATQREGLQTVLHVLTFRRPPELIEGDDGEDAGEPSTHSTQEPVERSLRAPTQHIHASSSTQHTHARIYFPGASVEGGVEKITSPPSHASFPCFRRGGGVCWSCEGYRLHVLLRLCEEGLEEAKVHSLGLLRGFIGCLHGLLDFLVSLLDVCRTFFAVFLSLRRAF